MARGKVDIGEGAFASFYFESSATETVQNIFYAVTSEQTFWFVFRLYLTRRLM